MIKHFNDYSNVLSYTIGRIKGSSAFNTSRLIYRYAKGYFLISRLIRISVAVVAFIETSATLIVFAGILLIAVPIAFALYAIFRVISIIEASRSRINPNELIKGTDKIIFILSNKPYLSKHNVFFRKMIKEFENTGYTVFVVSSCIFRDGIRSITRKSRNIYVIRLGTFYSIRKMLNGRQNATDITYIS